MLAAVRSIRAVQPKGAQALAQRTTAVPALVAARQQHVTARRAFSAQRALRASQSPDTFMNGTNASYAQAQFEAWQEVRPHTRSRSSPLRPRRNPVFFSVGRWLAGWTPSGREDH